MWQRQEKRALKFAAVFHAGAAADVGKYTPSTLCDPEQAKRACACILGGNPNVTNLGTQWRNPMTLGSAPPNAECLISWSDHQSLRIVEKRYLYFICAHHLRSKLPSMIYQTLWHFIIVPGIPRLTMESVRKYAFCKDLEGGWLS